MLAPLLLPRLSRCEPLASKLARWRAALSTAAAAADAGRLGSDGAGAAAPAAAALAAAAAAAAASAGSPSMAQSALAAQQPRRDRRLPLLASLDGATCSAAAAAAARRRPAPPNAAAAPFSSSSSSSSSSSRPSSADPPPPRRSPPRSGAGLGGGGGSGSGGGALASVIAAESGKTRVNAYVDDGFVINSVQVTGAVLCLPESWLMWDLGGAAGGGIAGGGEAAAGPRDLDALISSPEHALAVLDLVHPPPDVLVLGCGARAPARPPARLRAWLRGRGASLEVLRTADAVALFALLNDEGRPCVGAFLPPGVVVGDGG